MKNNQSLCNILKIPRHPEAHIRFEPPVLEAVPVACLHTDSDASLSDHRLRLGGDYRLPVDLYAVKPRVISAHPRLIRAVCVGFWVIGTTAHALSLGPSEVKRTVSVRVLTTGSHTVSVRTALSVTKTGSLTVTVSCNVSVLTTIFAVSRK